MPRLLAALSAALVIGAAAPPQPAPDTAAERVRAHVEFLADDLLEGRATGERGHAIAAAYVASQFRALGLKPGGTDGGWYQQVPFRRATHGQPAASATLSVNGMGLPLVIGRDFAVAPSLIERERTVDSGLVFAGYGISEPLLGIDDYAGLDVRGKTVVAFTETPAGIPTEIAAHLAATKAETAAARGAIGYIDVSRQPGHGSRPDRMGRFARDPIIDWADAKGQVGTQPANLRFTAAISAAIADRLFEGAPLSLAAVRAQAARRGARPAGFALRPRIAVRAISDWHHFSSPEVIGLLPGSDARLRDEHVVLMAHLDHLGINRAAKPGEDAIYNGALDNAAGIATMLEAAREFVHSGKPPRRSVLFIANTGEEIGLRGADYFAAHPTVPIGRIVGAVDLDMPVPLYEFTDVVAFGGEHSTIARTIEKAARGMGMSVSPDPMPEQSIFVRSDHYQFVRRGVPAILLFTGYANGGKAQWDHFFNRIYHTVRDDVRQPINWPAAARYAKLNYEISRALADAEQRPRWYQGDYFGDRFAPGQPRAVR